MQVGDIVMKTSAWSEDRAKELGKAGVVTKILPDRWVQVQWPSGQLEDHRMFELVVVGYPKTKKKPYFEAWQIKF